MSPTLLIFVALVCAGMVVPFQVVAGPTSAAASAERLEQEGYQLILENHLDIRLNGERTGEASSLLFHHPERTSRYVVVDHQDIRLNIMGMTTAIRETAEYHADEQYMLSAFSMQMQAHANVTVKGERTADKSAFEIELTSGGSTTRDRLDNDPPLSSPELVMAGWLEQGMRVGQRREGRMYIALTNTALSYSIEVVREGTLEIPTGEVEGFGIEIKAMGITDEVVIDSQGKVLYRASAQAGMLFESYPVDEGPAADAPTGGWLKNLLGGLGGDAPSVASADIFQHTLVDPGRKIQQPRNVTRMTATISGINDPGLIIDDAWQRVTQREETDAGLRVTFDIRTPKGGTDIALETLQAFEWPQEFRRRYLDPTLHVQSEHPAIVELAREITKESKTAREASLALTHWLAVNLQKDYRLTVPTAIEVLESMSGDCNEHATLYAALARAVGIPSRICVGLVYTSQFDAFGYHAWNESLVSMDEEEWTPKEWLPLDSTLNNADPVDATHIKLLEGDISDWIQVVGAIGAIELEVIDVSK